MHPASTIFHSVEMSRWLTASFTTIDGMFSAYIPRIRENEGGCVVVALIRIMAVISSLGLAPLDAESRLAFAITSSTAFALVAWEFITLLPYEIRLYRKSVWATAPPYAFLVLRYSSILATLPTIFLSAISTQNISCQTAASLSQAGMILVVISTAIIFTFRTAQLWAHNPKRNVLLASLGGLVLVVVGCCIAPAIQYRATSSTKSTSAAFTPSNCHILPTPPYLPLAPAASLVFLLSALILSLLQLRTHDRNEVSKFTYRLYRAHVLYLFGATLTCTAALVILSLAPPASGLALCVPPLFVVLTCAFGTRAFRNYMLARVLEEGESGRGSPAAPYPSVSPIISHASEARYGYTYADTQRPSMQAQTEPAALTPAPRRIQVRPRKDSYPRPPTSGSTAPLINVAGNTKLSPNPYTTFPSPPPSHDGHSTPSPLLSASSAPAPLSGSQYTSRTLATTMSSSPSRSALSVDGSSPSSSPQSFSPLRRAKVPRQQQHMPDMTKSGWSDS